MRHPFIVALLAAALPVGPAAAQSLGAAVSDAELGAIAGKADVANGIVNARNEAVVANNSVSGVSSTGIVSIDGQAFQSLTGLAVISVNTGNNVAINSSLNVNVTIRP